MSMPIYLSSTIPRWQPATEADIQAAINEGLLEETHYLDVKREVKSGGSANKELARDLASFAIDGGTVIVGVDEDKTTNTLSLAPQPFKGLPERIEQVARSVADQPLEVITSAIPSAADPERGYLLIHVPPSSVAPHMVDGRYIGRGDKTKTYLSDAEVVRLHESRSTITSDGIKLLRQEFKLDPIQQDQRVNAHLFLLAEPTPGRDSMLLDLLSGVNARQKLATFQQAAYAEDVKRAVDVSGISPELIRAYSYARRSRGAALTSNARESNAEFDEGIVEMEVHEDGGIRLFMGRLSAVHPQDGNLILEIGAVIYARQLIALTIAAAEESGYFGNWILAAGATGLKGKYSYQFARHYISERARQPYDADEYLRACIATYAELKQSPGQVAERLVGRLLRSLGTYDEYKNALKG
jgi:hypothetical protein